MLQQYELRSDGITLVRLLKRPVRYGPVTCRVAGRGTTGRGCTRAAGAARCVGRADRASPGCLSDKRRSPPARQAARVEPAAPSPRTARSRPPKRPPPTHRRAGSCIRRGAAGAARSAVRAGRPRLRAALVSGLTHRLQTPRTPNSSRDGAPTAPARAARARRPGEGKPPGARDRMPSLVTERFASRFTTRSPRGS
jgi:hypothetical protein